MIWDNFCSLGLSFLICEMGNSDHSHSRYVRNTWRHLHKGGPTCISFCPHTVCSLEDRASEIFYHTQFHVEMKKEQKHLCGCEFIKSLACIPLTLQDSFLFFFFLKNVQGTPQWKVQVFAAQYLRCLNQIKGNSLLHWDRLRDSPNSSPGSDPWVLSSKMSKNIAAQLAINRQ